MIITPAHLAALKTADPATWAPLLTKTIADNAIRAVPDFLANILHESGRLHTLRESLNYSVAALRNQWPNHFTAARAGELGRIDDAHGRTLRAADQWWIAEEAYGGRMGNRAPGHGDGWNFRGAGPLQNTGFDNLMAFSAAIGWTGTLLDLAAYLTTPAGGAAAAGQFWRARGCDAFPTSGAMRQRVNGGTNGLAEVLALRAEVVRVLGAAAPQTARPAPAPSNADTSADDLNAGQLARITGA